MLIIAHSEGGLLLLNSLKGLPESETLNGCIIYAQPDFSEIEIKKIVQHIYSTQSDSHNKLPLLQEVSSLQSDTTTVIKQ